MSKTLYILLFTSFFGMLSAQELTMFSGFFDFQYYQDEMSIKIIQEDAEVWIEKNKHRQFDLIFADTWAGKFTHLNQTLQMVKPGGFYIIDDLNRQENWPEGHQDKVIFLMEELKCQTSFSALPIDFGTGIMVLCRKFD